MSSSKYIANSPDNTSPRRSMGSRSLKQWWLPLERRERNEGIYTTNQGSKSKTQQFVPFCTRVCCDCPINDFTRNGFSTHLYKNLKIGEVQPRRLFWLLSQIDTHWFCCGGSHIACCCSSIYVGQHAIGTNPTWFEHPIGGYKHTCESSV